MAPVYPEFTHDIDVCCDGRGDVVIGIQLLGFRNMTMEVIFKYVGLIIPLLLTMAFILQRVTYWFLHCRTSYIKSFLLVLATYIVIDVLVRALNHGFTHTGDDVAMMFMTFGSFLSALVYGILIKIFEDKNVGIDQIMLLSMGMLLICLSLIWPVTFVLSYWVLW